MSTFLFPMSASHAFTSSEADQELRVSYDAVEQKGHIFPVLHSPNDRGFMNDHEKPTALTVPTTAGQHMSELRSFKDRDDNNEEEYTSAKSGFDSEEKINSNGIRHPFSWVTSRSSSRKPHPYKYVETEDPKAQEKLSSSRSWVDIGGASGSDTAVCMSKFGDAENGERGQTKGAMEQEQPVIGKVKLTRNYHLDGFIVPASDPKPSVLQRSFSTDFLPLFSGIERDLDKALRKTRVSSLHRMIQMTPDSSKGKDELWGIFRSLDGAYLKFKSKSTANKASIVRDNLIPFLQKYNSNPPKIGIRPEDLDRRTNILDKWWTGLLELVRGTLSSSMSGTDRLVILEGIVGIMERPEWRIHPSESYPISDRPSPPYNHRRRSASTCSSTGSDFLRDSVLHNTHNTFVRNIISQLAFSVEKMSLRTVPASVVAFSGKTLAYAFFFCAGVARILVWLWKIPKPTISRIMLSRRAGGLDEGTEGTIHESMLTNFPFLSHDLGSKSTLLTGRNFQKPVVPIEISHIPWFGTWSERWSGKESDLFYVFVKYYHILLTGCFSAKHSRLERTCAPGLIYVQSQMLVNLDATLHRHAHFQSSNMSLHPYTSFDEVLAETDVNVSALSFLPSNSVRQVAENRLILLLREFLSEDRPDRALSRLCFAEGFSDVLRAAASKVSAYDQSACSILCDFLEEAILILSRYEKLTKINGEIVDWPFWHRACKQMLRSHNTATETRLYSFLYTIWGFISRDHKLKADFCFTFLLDAEFFLGRFNHWCPMVRAYYMRLLCWRITRFGLEDDQNTHRQILITVLSRLKMVWNYFLKEAPHSKADKPYSTSPCNPAPGRRIIIIRTDNHNPASNAFLTLDGFPPISSTTQTASLRNSSPRIRLAPVDTKSQIPNDETKRGRNISDSEDGYSKWSLLRSVLTTSRSRSRSPNMPISNHEKGASPEFSGKNSPGSSSENILLNRNMSFKFSLEWLDRKAPVNGNMRLHCPQLPSHAQTFLDATNDLHDPHEFIRFDSTLLTREVIQYTGRALAEWSVLINECQNFFQRRKHEGVPSDEWVETPTLGVESMKKAS